MCMFDAPEPPPLPETPSRAADDVQAAQAAERDRARRARGRATTILTSGAGDTTAAPTATKRLLGE